MLHLHLLPAHRRCPRMLRTSHHTRSRDVRIARMRKGLGGGKKGLGTRCRRRAPGNVQEATAALLLS